MKIRYAFILVASFFLIGAMPSSGNEPHGVSSASNLKAKETSRKIDELAHDVAIIQRDQVNYRAEKDILKELYTTQIDRINTFLSVILGATAILGFFGLKSLTDLKKEYRDELDKLLELKTKLKFEIEDLQSKQSAFDVRIDEITKKNESQDNRLRVMEIIEKVGTFIGQNNHYWALRWANIGLELEPTNSILLAQKASCLSYLGEYSAAEHTYWKLLEVEPEDESHILNLIELYAITGKAAEFDAALEKHKEYLKSEKDGRLIYFLEAASHATSGRLQDATEKMVSYTQSYPGSGTRIENWSFGEAKACQGHMHSGPSKELFAHIIGLFSGEMESNFAIDGARKAAGIKQS